jgi:release factor glutamine methyltransferase
MAEVAIDALGEQRPGIAVDVGTGCGAVALALAAARPELEIHATDISRTALRWAGRNARRLGLGRVRFHRGSLLEALPAELRGRVSPVAANVPYVPAEMWRSRRWRDATVGLGPDGLDLQRRLAEQALAFLRPGGTLVLQLGASQWPGFAGELAGLGYRVEGVAGQGENVIGRAERRSAAAVG